MFTPEFVQLSTRHAMPHPTRVAMRGLGEGKRPGGLAAKTAAAILIRHFRGHHVLAAFTVAVKAM